MYKETTQISISQVILLFQRMVGCKLFVKKEPGTFAGQACSTLSPCVKDFGKVTILFTGKLVVRIRILPSEMHLKGAILRILPFRILKM